MRLALASSGFINENISYNKNSLITTLKECSGKADMVIFGEAFLQGFYGINFNPEHDESIAISLCDQHIEDIRLAARKYAIAVSFGCIEKDNNFFYSSQLTIDKSGQILDIFRRVSPGWKVLNAGDHYREGSHFHTFDFMEKHVLVALCGDMWFQENIVEISQLAPDIVLWPVYTDYTSDEWNTRTKYEYADQAQKACRQVIYVNSFCLDKAHEVEIAKGGASYFMSGKIIKELPSGAPGILLVDC